MMGSLQLQMTGDWNKAGLYLKNLAVRLCPEFAVKFYDSGEFVLEKMKNHITSQDLGWVPLSPHTIKLKNGDSTIMIETGTLLNGLTVRRVKSSTSGDTLFVGASPWKRHAPSGLGLDELMVYLEYGTSNMPARPLIRPTIEEVTEQLHSMWSKDFESIIKEGV